MTNFSAKYYCEFNEIISNIKQKSNLTLRYAAALHQQLEYIKIYVNQNNTNGYIVVDSFLALTSHLCGYKEILHILKNFDIYARALVGIKEGQNVKENLEDYIRRRETYLRIFYDEIVDDDDVDDDDVDVDVDDDDSTAAGVDEDDDDCQCILIKENDIEYIILH